MSINIKSNGIRFDLQIVSSWIKPGCRVLDLGCGQGDLLYDLTQNKGISGFGIEFDEQKVAMCIERGLSVLQGDINNELKDYPDASYDYVILSQTLQQVYEPRRLIAEMLRVGRQVVVSFPNFGHFMVRTQLLLTGYAPITGQLPYQWYDTPNIRVITIKDFIRFSKQNHFNIIKEVAVNTDRHNKKGTIVRFLPNLLATYGIFLVGSKSVCENI